jgi:hypothetical protein
MRFIVKHEEYSLRALADTGISFNIMLEANTSDPLIKADDINTTN